MADRGRSGTLATVDDRVARSARLAAVLGALACVTRHASDAERLLDEAERWLHGQAFELCARHRELIAPEA